MYDAAVEEHDRGEEPPLTHEPLCVRCGHSAHIHLPCGGGCDCGPTAMPGAERVRD